MDSGAAVFFNQPGRLEKQLGAQSKQGRQASVCEPVFAESEIRLERRWHALTTFFSIALMSISHNLL